MDKNIKNKYSQIHSETKRCEDNTLGVVQKISKMANFNERHQLLKQLNGEVSTLTQIATEVLTDIIKM